MEKEKNNNQHDHLSGETESMISGTRIGWEKSKEEVWLKLEKKIEQEPAGRKNIIFKPWIKVALVAGIALLTGITAFITFYTKTLTVPAGQHAEIYLPDNSRMDLNAMSTFSYKPFLWKFARTIKFEGEAYFSVMKGKRFEVISGNGKTVVLGTTFNIYSRNSDYQVTCITGKVKVTGVQDNTDMLLNPGQQAELGTDGTLILKSGIDTCEIVSWVSNKLSFTSVPLRKVFDEIERQYGIIIDVPGDIDYYYTGTFMKESSVDNILNLVCRPFDLEVTRKTGDEYIISRNK